MIKEVLTIGDARLLQTSLPVNLSEFNTEKLQLLITDMRDTMKSRGGVGISAVQIGIAKRIAIIEFDGNNPRYRDIGDCPLTVIINPLVESIDDELIEYPEGCLSVPEIRALVARPKGVRYSFYDQTGRLIKGVSDQFFARVLQHEVDHMDGILFPMRVKQMNRKEI